MTTPDEPRLPELGDDPVEPRRGEPALDGSLRGGDRMGSPAEVETANRHRQVLQLRLAGLDYETIAKRTGYADKSGAQRAFKAAIAKHTRAAAREALDLEDARLDALQAPFWLRAVQGHLPSAEMVVKIMAARAKLHGLNGAVKIDLTGENALQEVLDVADQLQAFIDRQSDPDDPNEPLVPL